MLAGQESFGLYNSADYFCSKPSSDNFSLKFTTTLIPERVIDLFRFSELRWFDELERKRRKEMEGKYNPRSPGRKVNELI